MKKNYLRTSDIAKAVGVHPNTVRLYEEWGFLQPVPRTSSGYRMFAEAHLDQMRFARTALHGGWPGRNIRHSALSLVRQAAAGNLRVALEQAHHHVTLVQAERVQAEAAADFLEQWAKGTFVETTYKGLQIGETAKLLEVSVDMLHDWERNGLLDVPRNPHNRYRCYGAVEIGRLRVIRMLRLAGYSTMAILRMLLQFDQGKNVNLRQVLDTPRPDEDVYFATDRWLSTLETHQKRANELVNQLQEMVRKYQNQVGAR